MKKQIFKFLTGLNLDDFTEIINTEKNSQSIYIEKGSNELYDNFLFDFSNYGDGAIYRGGTIYDDNGKVLEKIQIKPIDILNELEVTPNILSLQNINDKIEILKIKESIITQKYAKREISGLIERLENRKKYNDFKEFFCQFQNTTEEAIAKITEKYTLVMKDADLFVPEFPIDAVNIMQKYSEKTKEVCGKNVEFYVIATSDSFKDVSGKRDPILLAQSPFGFFYQILGAWDKEMLYLPEL